jgi:SAM-dependent methyltransferase
VNNQPVQWERAAAEIGEPSYRLWRDHSDAVNRRLLERWLWPAAVADEARERTSSERLLKTDLFDEAVGQGLCGDARAGGYARAGGDARSGGDARLRSVYGMDVSSAVVRRARAGSPDLDCVTADVRRLPFADGVFDVVISLSTLDHFETADEILASLREIRRTLRPEGRLLLTLDNPANPKIRVRNALPWALLRRTRIVPYFVGRSLGPRRLERELVAAGFEVIEMGAIVHCPRVLAVAASRLPALAGARARGRFLDLLQRFEALAQWPTRFVTGHFVAVLARRTP